MQFKLDEKYQLVLQDSKNNKVCPVDGYSEAMLLCLDWLNNNKTVKEGSLQDIVFSHIHSDKLQRGIIEALLFSDCPTKLISDAFYVPTKAIEIYKELFFDTTKFITRLDKLTYLETLDADDGNLKLRAFNEGYQYIITLYSGYIPDKQYQLDSLNRLFIATANKAMNICYSGSKSDDSKSAREYAKLLLQIKDTIQRASAGYEFDNSKDAISKIEYGNDPEYMNTYKNHSAEVSDTIV